MEKKTKTILTQWKKSEKIRLPPNSGHTLAPNQNEQDKNNIP